MPHGGKRKGAGRPRQLSASERFRAGDECEKQSCARAASKAYLRDPLNPRSVPFPRQKGHRAENSHSREEAPQARERAHGFALLDRASSVPAGGPDRPLFPQPEYQVYIRVGGHDDQIYLDLADATWRVI